MDAEDTDRWTARPRLIAVSAVVGVRCDGVTRRERTEDATDVRLDATFGVDGTDCDGRGGGRSRRLRVEVVDKEEVRTRTDAGFVVEVDAGAGVSMTSSKAGSDASDAVLKAVDASLAVDTFDVGRTAEEGVGLLLRTVDARERTERTEAADDLGVEVDDSATGGTICGGGGRREDATDDRLLATDWRSVAERKEGAREDAEDVGVSLESGRGSSTFRRGELTGLREVVERVLRATDRTDGVSEANLVVMVAPFGLVVERTLLGARVECMLTESLSSVLFVTRRPPEDICVADLLSELLGTNNSSTGTSISAVI